MGSLHVADVGRGVYVSGFRHCAAERAQYDLGIHIYRDNQSWENRCSVLQAAPQGVPDGDLVVRYTEGQPLATMSVPLSDVVAFARRPGRLLVHCEAGMFRGPMLALVSLVARGITPAAALVGLLEGQWRDRGHGFSMDSRPLKELLLFWETNR